MHFKFNIEEAIEFSQKGCIEEWIHIFLKTVGGNIALSNGLKLQKRYWLGPILLRIDQLTRCCGPEEGMEYFNSFDEWEEQIKLFCNLIESGWKQAPLIAEHKDGNLILRDGNHRHEAMKRLGINECWVVIWENDDPNNLVKWK